MLPPLLVVCVRSDTLRTQRGDKHVDNLFASSHLARSTRPHSSRHPHVALPPLRMLTCGPSGVAPTRWTKRWSVCDDRPFDVDERPEPVRSPAVGGDGRAAPASSGRTHPQPARLSRHVVNRPSSRDLRRGRISPDSTGVKTMMRHLLEWDSAHPHPGLSHGSHSPDRPTEPIPTGGPPDPHPRRTTKFTWPSRLAYCRARTRSPASARDRRVPGRIEGDASDRATLRRGR